MFSDLNVYHPSKILFQLRVILTRRLVDPGSAAKKIKVISII